MTKRDTAENPSRLSTGNPSSAFFLVSFRKFLVNKNPFREKAKELSNNNIQNEISSILKDKNNRKLMWIISEQGLFKLDILSNNIEKLKLEIQENISFSKGIIDN